MEKVEDLAQKGLELGLDVVSKALHVGQFVLTRLQGGAWAELDFSDPLEPQVTNVKEQ